MGLKNPLPSPGVCLGLLLLSGLHAQPVKSNELPPDTLIVLQRGACEHRCAVYKLILFNDGSVVFDGRAYVRHAGLVKAGMPLEAVTNLLDRATAIGFFDPKRYTNDPAGCSSHRSDAPEAILSISTAGQARTILHSHSCVSPEWDRLTQLEDDIDRAAGAVRWIR